MQSLESCALTPKQDTAELYSWVVHYGTPGVTTVTSD